MNFDQHKIEDYLFGRLSEDELATFQFALLRNAALRKEVETLRTLKYLARAKKRKNKKSVVFLSPKRLWRVAAIFIGITTLAVLIALFLNKEPEIPNVHNKKINPVENKESKNEGIVDKQEDENIDVENKEEIVNSPDKGTPETEPENNQNNTPNKKEDEIVKEKINNKKLPPKRKLEYEIYDPRKLQEQAQVGEFDSLKSNKAPIDTIPPEQLKPSAYNFEKLLESKLKTKKLRIDLNHRALLFWELNGSTKLTIEGKAITKDGKLPEDHVFIRSNRRPDQSEVPKIDYQLFAASMPDEPLMEYSLDYRFTDKFGK